LDVINTLQGRAAESLECETLRYSLFPGRFCTFSIREIIVTDQLDSRSDQFVGNRTSVLLNVGFDLALFAVALIYAPVTLPHEPTWQRIILVLFFLRIPIWSERGPALSVQVPKAVAELNPKRDLTLFAAYRFLGRVWLIAGILLSFAVGSRDPAWLISHIPPVIWALLILQVHLPERLLQWRGFSTRAPSPPAIPVTTNWWPQRPE
jgi:hypothetical protein